MHGLLACGGEDGAIECFDLRQKAAVGRIITGDSTGNAYQVVVLVILPSTIFNTS